MTPCPKCGQKRKIYNISQYCPNCKTNLFFYGFEERFYEDAKAAEMSLANVRVKLQKVKTGLVGGKLQVMRLASVLLPVLALLIPFKGINISLPVYSKSISVGAIGLFSSFSDGTLSVLSKLSGASIVGDAAALLQRTMYGLLACAAAAVLVFLLSVLSFISFKKMATIISAVSLAGVAAGFFTGVTVSSIKPLGEFITVQSGYGIYAVCAAFLIVSILNLVIAVNGLNITYKPGDTERIEMRRKYKNKEISLADIPYPIYMTEEERVKRQAAIEKTAAEMAQAVEGGEDDG